jgi:Flp pilus assembly pilin Flp
MQRPAAILRSLLHDENGAEVLEYAFVLGLVIVAAITVIGAVGAKVVARWTSINSGM